MYIKYNDFELLYLIDSGSEEAYFALVHKYSYYIHKKISDFHMKEKYREDFFQEGLMVLDEAIKKYDEYRGKSFNRYFDMLLVHRFQRLLALEKNYFYNVSLVEFPEMLEEQVSEFETNDSVNSIVEELDRLKFSELEKSIYMFVLNGLKPREIAKKTNMDIKVVYNAICRSSKRIQSAKKREMIKEGYSG